MRKAFFALDKEEKQRGRDILWFIWSSPASPLFGKDKMATFERYFLAEKETHVEKKNSYYRLLEDENVVDNIFREFGDRGGLLPYYKRPCTCITRQGKVLLNAAARCWSLTGDFQRHIRKRQE